MEAGESVVKTCAVTRQSCPKPNSELPNGNLNSPSTSDSDYEYRKRNSFCLGSQRKPQASLKFILTLWYSPETSSAIVEAMSSVYSEVELREILASPSKDILHFSEKFFETLGI